MKKKSDEALEEPEAGNEIIAKNPDLWMLKWSLIWLAVAVVTIFSVQHVYWVAGGKTPIDWANEAVFQLYGGQIVSEGESVGELIPTSIATAEVGPQIACQTDKILKFIYNPDGSVENINFEGVVPGAVFYISAADYPWWQTNIDTVLTVLPQNLEGVLGQSFSPESWDKSLAESKTLPCFQIPTSQVEVAQVAATSTPVGVYVQPAQFVVAMPANQFSVASPRVIVQQLSSATVTPSPQDFLAGCSAAGVSDPVHCAEIAKQLAGETGVTFGVLPIAIDMSGRSNCRVYLHTASFAELVSAYSSNPQGHGQRVKNEGVAFLRLWLNGAGKTSAVGDWRDSNRYKICVDEVVGVPDQAAGRDWELGNKSWPKSGGLVSVPFAQSELYGGFVSFIGPIGLVDGYYESAEYIPGVDIFPVVSKLVVAPPPANVQVVVTSVAQPQPTEVMQIISSLDLTAYLTSLGVNYLESECLDDPTGHDGQITGYPQNVRMDAGRGKSVYVNFSTLPVRFKGCGQPTSNSDFTGFSRVYGVKLVVTRDNHSGETDWYCTNGLCFYPFVP